jgi:hypothetical protein
MWLFKIYLAEKLRNLKPVYANTKFIIILITLTDKKASIIIKHKLFWLRKT